MADAGGRIARVPCKERPEASSGADDQAATGDGYGRLEQWTVVRDDAARQVIRLRAELHCVYQARHIGIVVPRLKPWVIFAPEHVTKDGAA